MAQIGCVAADSKDSEILEKRRRFRRLNFRARRSYLAICVALNLNRRIRRLVIESGGICGQPESALIERLQLTSDNLTRSLRCRHIHVTRPPLNVGVPETSFMRQPSSFAFVLILALIVS